MVKVSVIIPIYNVDKYLPRCLDSLINQTLKDIEIICINDCSPDNSLKVLEEYQKKDDRIKIIDLKENQGAAVARNKGLEVATGEYLGFVDPDDYVDLNFYEELYNKAVEENANIAKANLKSIGTNQNEKICTLNDIIETRNDKFLFSYCWTTAIYSNSMIKQNNIIFPEECRIGQDIVFLFRCVLRANKISLLNNIFYYYIRREDSLDFGELSYEKVLSNLKANRLILNELNSSNLFLTDPDIYVRAYYLHLKDIFYPLFKTKTQKARFECSKTLIDMYNACKLPNKLNEIYETPLLLPYINSNDPKGMTNELIKYNTLEKFIAQCRINELRTNVKKDMQHA